MTAKSPEIGKAASATVLDGAQVSLTQMMRKRTHSLHAQAERSGVVNDILRGKASRYGYALLLRNLLPAYRQLEAGLEAHWRSPAVRAAARREIYRAPALMSDLTAIFGAGWENALPLLPAGEQYGRRIAVAAQGDGTGLIAHAYTRYFGDLSGGQVLKRLLVRSLGLRPQELAFYDFLKIKEIEAFKQDYRRAIDDSAASIADVGMVVLEAMTAFELNIAVSEAVQQVTASPA
jgi:heme oxygenase